MKYRTGPPTLTKKQGTLFSEKGLLSIALGSPLQNLQVLAKAVQAWTAQGRVHGHDQFISMAN